MLRGHGQPGLIDLIPTYSDLMDQSSAGRRPYLEYFPGEHVTDWALHSAGIYKATVTRVYGGIIRDVVCVETSLGRLSRAESVATMTSGTFYADIGSALFAPERWDMGGPPPGFDDYGTVWDAYPESLYPPLVVYIRLPGDASPFAQTIAPLFGFYMSTRGEVHPELGPSTVLDGEFDTLAPWTQVVNGAGWGDGVDVLLHKSRVGASSVKLISVGTATGDASVSQDIATIPAQVYRLNGAYRTPSDFSTNLEARLLVSNVAASTFLYEDGRNYDASGTIPLRPTGGEWRRFLLDFYALEASTRFRFQLRGPTTPAAGQLNFDDVRLQRVWRYNLYQPRIDAASLPEVEVASQSLFFGGKTVGLGRVAIVNNEGDLDSVFGSLLLANKPMRAYVGGAFGDGSEIYRDDWRSAWPGISRMPRWTRERWSFDVDDERALFAARKLPTRTYTVAEFPNMEKGMIGKARPLVFGALGFGDLIRPTRIDKTAEGYGIYELADATDWPYGDGVAPGCYRTSQEAELSGRGTGSAIVNTPTDPGFDTIDDDHLRFSIHHDTRAMQKGDMFGPLRAEDTLPIDFNIGAGALVATCFFAGEPRLVALSLASEMSFVSGVTINVAYNETTHLITISRPTGTLQLLTGTGTNRQNGAWPRLGYKTGTDRTGALSYVADDVLFTDVDADHFWRARGSLRDSLTGTITGVPDGAIKLQSDVAKLIFYAYLKWPLSKIDSASFAAARAAEPTAEPNYYNAALWLGKATSVSEILARIERAGLFDLVLDGDGVVHCISSLATTWPVADFFDYDYHSFEVEYTEPYCKVHVLYDFDPHRDEYRTVELANDTVPTLHGRNEVLSLETSLFDFDPGEVFGLVASGNARQLARRVSRLAQQPLLRVTFTARGKLVDRLIGHKIRITAARAPTPTGRLDAVTFRITALKHNFLTGISRCVAVEAPDLAAVP